MNRVFQAGLDHGKEGQERTWHAKELVATAIPLLSIVAKDHKKLSTNGDPKTRPMCGACHSINGELSEWVSLILDSANNCEDTDESIGTEDMMHEVDVLVKHLSRG